jgi:membrane protein YdbS with pleckstrin-like domain
MAGRMQRYSVYLMLCAFLLIAANIGALTLEAVLWFAAGVCAAFALLCAIAVVVLHAVAWNFDRMREELRGGRSAVDMRDPTAATGG